MISRYQEFVTGITVCYKTIQRIKNTAMTQFGLRGTHVACLFHLHHNQEGLTAAQLCTLCAEDKAAISRVLSDLRQRGFITREDGKNYRAPLHLTDSGREIACRMDGVITSWVESGRGDLTQEEMDTFYTGLTTVSQNLQHRLSQYEGSEKETV